MAAEPAVAGSATVREAVAAARGGAVDDQAAREIVAALLDVGRHWVALHPDAPIEATLCARAAAAARRLADGMPFQYAVGRASFRQLTLDVDARVLIPRPETELLVDLVLAELAGEPGGIAVDVGTGSGAIALSLAVEGTFDRVIGTDISADALMVARENARRCAQDVAGRAGSSAVVPRVESGRSAAVEFRQGSGLAPVAGVLARTIVSNPPYIAFDEAGQLPASVRDWEPAVALFSGEGGLEATRALVRGAARALESRGLLALEVDTRRASLVAEMVAADAAFGDVAVRLDLTGRERFVLARRLERK